MLRSTVGAAVTAEVEEPGGGPVTDAGLADPEHATMQDSENSASGYLIKAAIITPREPDRIILAKDRC